VVTHRDDELNWPNARRLEGDLAPGVREITAKTEGRLAVLGSGALVAQLLEADLVDEFQLFVHPLVLGSGHELFPRRDALLRLDLQEVQRTATGVVALRYVIQR
jgi:dihydrofolate reductase